MEIAEKKKTKQNRVRWPSTCSNNFNTRYHPQLSTTLLYNISIYIISISLSTPPLFSLITIVGCSSLTRTSDCASYTQTYLGCNYLLLCLSLHTTLTTNNQHKSSYNNSYIKDRNQFRPHSTIKGRKGYFPRFGMGNSDPLAGIVIVLKQFT